MSPGAEMWSEHAGGRDGELQAQAAGNDGPEKSFSMVSIPSGGGRTVPEMRERLKLLQGKVFVNKSTGIQAAIEARVSAKTKGNAGASHMSVTNLKRFGISVEDAPTIHYTAATRIHELFENAEDGFFEEAYKQDSSKAGAYHLFNTVEVEGFGKFDVNVTAIAPENKERINTLYTIELTIENPSDNDKSHTLSLGGSLPEASGVSTRNLSSYRSFVEKEKASIKKKAVADGTFMKAPNGADTNLTEDQWLSVRTKAFKNWFGDWEKAAGFKAAVERIMTMEPVAAISGQEFQPDGRKLTEKVSEFWNEKYQGVAVHPEIGEVKLDVRGGKASLTHRIGGVKTDAFALVHDVIEQGVIVKHAPNWKGHGDDSFVIAAPVTIKGGRVHLRGDGHARGNAHRLLPSRSPDKGKAPRCVQDRGGYRRIRSP